MFPPTRRSGQKGRAKRNRRWESAWARDARTGRYASAGSGRSVQIESALVAAATRVGADRLREEWREAGAGLVDVGGKARVALVETGEAHVHRRAARVEPTVDEQAMALGDIHGLRRC